VRQELERRGPIQSDDEEAKGLRKRADEMARQSPASNGCYEAGTETIFAPARAFTQAADAPSETRAAQDIKKEETTSGNPRRGSSNDAKSYSGERRNDDGDSHRRKSHDRPPPDNDDDGRGDDDEPRRGKNDYKRDVEKEDRKPEKATQMGEEVETNQINHQTTTQNEGRRIQRKTKRRNVNP
jgi:hypothetical protein